MDITVSDELISVWICLSMLESFEASVAPLSSSARTAISFPDRAVFMASRNAFALFGSIAFRIGPSWLRNCPRSAASWVCERGMVSPSFSTRPLSLPG